MNRNPPSNIAPYSRMELNRLNINQNTKDLCCEFTEANYENTQPIHKYNKDKYDPMTDYMYKNGLINRDNNFNYDDPAGAILTGLYADQGKATVATNELSLVLLLCY